MDDEFQNEFIKLGFSCNTQEKQYSCPHPTEYYLFVQSPVEYLFTGKIPFSEYIKAHNASKYLEWQKRPRCLACLNTMLSVLDCGGWYNNIRVIDSTGKDVTYNHWTDYLDVLDPNAPIWEDE